jgi:hypothetical protein
VIQQLNHLSRVLEGEDVSENRIFAARPKLEGPELQRGLPSSSVSSGEPAGIPSQVVTPGPEKTPDSGELERKVFGEAASKDFSIENELQKRVLGTLVEPDSLPDLKGLR